MEAASACQRFRFAARINATSFRRSIPDLVVNLASSSDEGPPGVTALRKKMAAYQGNGARLVWLLPHAQAEEVRLANGEPQQLEQGPVLEASAEFPGLQLQLAEICIG
ncbi:Uma2 family endonuclease [Cyanobium sp. FACHB-13342]|uniref:Uma2 family endonuclease n=1 Tax=Cyanobium sp. FACHB-13342 TaxID=2692793 RepID=UPI0016800E22|nr:Uma2 family endonuclease [Cyanobium sp. FACHB-13342]MBD2422488.1 Uma2 family endonuclease [Cyanobium sp. FACHB-13342]